MKSLKPTITWLLSVVLTAILASSHAVAQDNHSQRTEEAKAQRLLLRKMYLGEDTAARDSAQLFRMMLESSPKSLRADEANDTLLLEPMRISVAREAASPIIPTEWSEKRSESGELAVELVVDYTNGHIGADPVRLRSYNRQLVGPTLRVKAGDVLKINLQNKLPSDSQAGHANDHHGWNITNLHFHGLHVAPQGTPEAESDNVFLSISGPTGEQNYEVQIPDDHVAGTFWYHAHKHGSVSAQVSSGLAGALIIERDDDTHNLDSIDAIGDAREQILVFQQVPYLKRTDGVGVIELDTVPNAAARMFGPNQWHQSGRFTTVNGQRLPVITIAPGQTQRWRMIHSGQREALKLQLVEDPQQATGEPRSIEFHEIALDGLPLGFVESKESILMYPGYRSDAMVKAPQQGGVFYLIDAASPAGETLQGGPDPLKFIAKVIVAGEPRDDAVPTNDEVASHRLEDINPSDVSGTQRAYYGIAFPPNDVAFYLSKEEDVAVGQVPSGREYNPNDVREVELGKTERWFVGSRNSTGIPPAGQPHHPFHIHVNPFLIAKVTDENGDEISGFRPVWRDTLAMRQGYTYELLTKYETFTGEFVQHCHILDHEDQGMMEKVRIVDPTSPNSGNGLDRSIAKTESVTPDANPLGANPNGSLFADKSLTNTLLDGDNKRHSLAEYSGQPVVALLIKGSYCPHCLEQVNTFARELTPSGCEVIVVTSEASDDLSKLPDLPFKLLADPDRKLFKKLGAFDREPQHGTFVFDANGNVRFRDTGEAPFMDVARIRQELNLLNAVASVRLTIRGTANPDDDYLTWAATKCTASVINGDPNATDLRVTLQNDSPSSNPVGGNVAFATTVGPNQTATSPSITLALPQDGTPVEFFVAGSKASTLTPSSLTSGGRDAVIEVSDSASGDLLSSHAVMVRVRKSTLNISEFELDHYLQAVADLHNVQRRYEWYVELHRLASRHSGQWPDQAHAFSAFVAWHRAYLLQFERELQERFPYVAIPYWEQGRQQNFFSRKALGVTDLSGIVRFDPPALGGSPLHNWQISLDHDPPLSPITMGTLKRRSRDHNTPPTFPAFRTFADFAGIDDYRAFVPKTESSAGVESNPHDYGHGWVGPSNIWMSNCRESPADPVFWIFHCNHDYLWAMWQHDRDRFQTDGSDARHYFPADEFAGSLFPNIPKGHHLKDTMWPWDQTSGPHPTLGFNANRPSSNPYGAFPAAPTNSQLWPTSPAAPKPADMIDYLGMASNRLELGFCYDEVPFGARSTGGRFLVQDDNTEEQTLADKILGTEGIDAALQSEAAMQLSDSELSRRADALRTLVQSESVSVDRKGAILRRMFATTPDSAARVAVSVLDDEKANISFKLHTLDSMSHAMHFSQVDDASRKLIMNSFRSQLDGGIASRLRVESAIRLAAFKDGDALRVLLEQLSDSEAAPVPIEQVIMVLRFYPKARKQLLNELSSPNDTRAIAAIEAVAASPEGISQILRIVSDSDRSNEVRIAAIQAVAGKHDDGVLDAVIEVASDKLANNLLRIEALTAVQRNLDWNREKLNDTYKRSVLTKLDHLNTDGPDGLPIRRLKDLVVEKLKNATPPR